MTKPSHSSVIPIFIAALFFLCLLTSSSSAFPGQADDETVWESFRIWMLTNPPQATLKAFGEKLAAEGMEKEEVQQRLEIIRRIFTEQPERGVEITFDRTFSKPLTGDPEKDGFTSTPSIFMMDSVKGMETGRALDVGAGQGRNAVWLAQEGWEVTAIDISSEGLAAALNNAEKAGVSLTTLKTTYQDFDFGTDQWDLIVMILSWAPVSDPDFVARLHASLKKGGVLVFEHVLETEKQTFPPVVQGLPPNALLTHFQNFHIQKYEEGVWLGDWGGPPAELVRMIARKK